LLKTRLTKKKQPRLKIRSPQQDAEDLPVPVRANLMVVDAEDVEPGDIIGQDSARNNQDQDITGGCRV